MGYTIYKDGAWTRKDTTEQYVYKGIKNVTEFPEFIKICKLSSKSLKQFLVKKLEEFYDKDKIHAGDGYLFAEGNDPYLLTAHMDTVHDKLVEDFYEAKYEDEDEETGEQYVYHTISSPQGIGGDDRCGIWMILYILTNSKHRPGVLFCEDEEIGGVGSDKFCKTEYINNLKEMKFLIELDRANATDLVFYEDGNAEFHEWCKEITGYEEEYGSFSDISNLSPECGVSSVNISCGYYYPHTLKEIVVPEEMIDSAETVIYMLDVATDENVNQFKYEQRKPYYLDFASTYYSRYGYDNYDFGWKPNTTTNANVTKRLLVEFQYESMDRGVDSDVVEVKGNDINECWVNFFKEYPFVCFNDVLDYDFYA